MREESTPWDHVPDWILAVGPVVVVALVAALIYVTNPFADLDTVAEQGTFQILWVLTIVGAIAGIVPVAIGMLWFPFIQRLDPRYVHGFVALGAGVLAFIAVEMTENMLEYGGEVDATAVFAAVAVAGVVGTFLAMYGLSRWREGVTERDSKTGLQIAYLVAIALGLHSIGEGLAIGVNLIEPDVRMVLLLVVGFVIHNILEGLTVVSAIARDGRTPRLWHFGAVGLVAGGPVILGGWFGSLGTSALLATAFYAIAIGAIFQAIVEMIDLVRIDTGALVTRLNAATFLLGFAVMFVLEDVIVEGWIVPG